MARSLLVPGLLFTALGAGCDAGTGPPMSPVVGIWGGKEAGLIAADTGVHVHIGCTLGDIKGQIRPDPYGRFSVAGVYNVDAYPVDRGILHPARFSGRIVGRVMTLTVTLMDTTRQLGPVTLRYGDEPQMGVCPICRNGLIPMWRLRSLSPHRQALGEPSLSRPPAGGLFAAGGIGGWR